MKIIYNVAKMDTHRKGKDGLPIGTKGAIICYGREQWFVDLELEEDREKFSKFVAETSDEDKWSWEDTLHSMLCVEDVDTAWYKYYVDGECINVVLAFAQ